MEGQDKMDQAEPLALNDLLLQHLATAGLEPKLLEEAGLLLRNLV